MALAMWVQGGARGVAKHIALATLMGVLALIVVRTAVVLCARGGRKGPGEVGDASGEDSLEMAGLMTD